MSNKISRWSQFINEGKASSKDLAADIKTVKDVEEFILGLAMDGNLFHFDDPADDLNGDPFTKEEAKVVNAKMKKSFEVCEEKLGPHGVWEEGFVRGVFVGYVAFGAEDDLVYVVAGSGGKGNVKKTTQADLDKNVNLVDGVTDEEPDEHQIDKWFKSLKKV